MCCLEDDLGGASGLESLLPAGRAQTPLVSAFEAGKSIVGCWGTEVVSLRLTEGQELIGHHGTDHVHARIIASGLTTSRAVVAGHRIERARLQIGSKDIALGHDTSSFVRELACLKCELPDRELPDRELHDCDVEQSADQVRDPTCSEEDRHLAYGTLGDGTFGRSPNDSADDGGSDDTDEYRTDLGRCP